MASFVPYQIDYSVKNAAKTIAFSKKRVSFKFGFASPTALADGSSTGPACRGSEHELTFVWSLATGKRQLLLDNKDLHFSESGQNGWTNDRVWQHAFSVRDAATGQSFRALFVSQAAVNPHDNSPQHPFDFRIGGISYFEFNALYQLGTSSMVTHREQQARGGGRMSAHHTGRDSPMTAEERRQLATAKLASLQDIAQSQPETKEPAPPVATRPAPAMTHEETSLISFDDDPPPPVPAAASFQQPATSLGGTTVPTSNTNYYFASSLTLDPMMDPAAPPLAPPHAPPLSSSMYGSNPYGAPPPQPSGSYLVNPYAVPPPSENPYGMPMAENPYGLPPTAPPPAAYSSSQALTPYNPSGSAAPPQPVNNPYVDATGRFAVGPAPPPPVSTNYYDLGSTSHHSYAAPAAPGPPNAFNLSSPGAVSYGSAPSFAQPPPAPVAPPYGTYPAQTAAPPMYGAAPTQPPYYPPQQAPPQYNY